MMIASAPSPKFNVDLPVGPDEPKAESERFQTILSKVMIDISIVAGTHSPE
jgi:hypothetical protein